MSEGRITMPVWVNIKRVEQQEVELSGVLTPLELDIEELDDLIRLEHPLHYDLRVRKAGSELVLSGCLSFKLECICARCLRPFQKSVRMTGYQGVIPLEGEESPPLINDSVDLTPFIREDTLLALPTTPVCGTDCPGLPRPESGRGEAAWEKGPDIWAKLNQLKKDI